MKKKLSILLICVLCFILVGCDSSNSTNGLTNDTIIMTLSTTGSGEMMSYNNMEDMKNNYKITYGGSITDKNNITKQMSDSDISTMRNYYTKFCNHDIKFTEDPILDCPTYEVIVIDKLHDFSSNATNENTYQYQYKYGKQDECVHELTIMIDKYFD